MPALLNLDAKASYDVPSAVNTIGACWTSDAIQSEGGSPVEQSFDAELARAAYDGNMSSIDNGAISSGYLNPAIPSSAVGTAPVQVNAHVAVDGKASLVGGRTSAGRQGRESGMTEGPTMDAALPSGRSRLLGPRLTSDTGMAPDQPAGDTRGCDSATVGSEAAGGSQGQAASHRSSRVGAATDRSAIKHARSDEAKLGSSDQVRADDHLPPGGSTEQIQSPQADDPGDTGRFEPPGAPGGSHGGFSAVEPATTAVESNRSLPQPGSDQPDQSHDAAERARLDARSAIQQAAAADVPTTPGSGGHASDEAKATAHGGKHQQRPIVTAASSRPGSVSGATATASKHANQSFRFAVVSNGDVDTSTAANHSSNLGQADQDTRRSSDANSGAGSANLSGGDAPGFLDGVAASSAPATVGPQSSEISGSSLPTLGVQPETAAFTSGLARLGAATTSTSSPVETGEAAVSGPAPLVTLASSAAGSELTVSLSTDVLGRVAVKIDRDRAGLAKVTVSASGAQALRSLIADEKQLREVLDVAGVSNVGRHVVFELASDPSAASPAGAKSGAVDDPHPGNLLISEPQDGATASGHDDFADRGQSRREREWVGGAAGPTQLGVGNRSDTADIGSIRTRMTHSSKGLPVGGINITA